MFAKHCRILHMSRIRKRRHKDPSCARASSVGLVIVVPHCLVVFISNITALLRLCIKPGPPACQSDALTTTQSAPRVLEFEK